MQCSSLCRGLIAAFVKLSKEYNPVTADISCFLISLTLYGLNPFRSKVKMIWLVILHHLQSLPMYQSSSRKRPSQEIVTLSRLLSRGNGNGRVSPQTLWPKKKKIIRQEKRAVVRNVL